MADKPKGVPLFGNFIHKPYVDYVTAVGQVAFYWNALHEALGLLFVEVVGTSRKVGLGIWYATQSDRAQRDMLLAAIRGRDGEDPPWTNHHLKAVADILWIVNEVQGSLAERRNNAIHAPAEMHINIHERQDGQLLPSDFEIQPSFYYGNPRATKLKGKALIDEFDWYAVTARDLARFTDAIVEALVSKHKEWPQRPRLPSLGQKLG